MTSEDAEDVLDISSPEQFAALAHPLRQRLLFALTHEAATLSQLAARLGTAKGSVAHHLKVLREAGLVRVVETRRVRGGTEQYYRRIGRRIQVTEPQAATTAALLGAVSQELDASPGDELLTLRHLRLTPERARQLREALAELVDEAEDAKDTEDAEGEAEAGKAGERRVYGVLAVMYEHPEPNTH